MACEMAEHETIWFISSFAIYNSITAIYMYIYTGTKQITVC